MDSTRAFDKSREGARWCRLDFRHSPHVRVEVLGVEVVHPELERAQTELDHLLVFRLQQDAHASQSVETGWIGD